MSLTPKSTLSFISSLNLDEPLRNRLYSGEILISQPDDSAKALRDWTSLCINEAFEKIGDPRTAQFDVEVAEFISIISPMKSFFTNHEKTKNLVREMLLASGVDPNRTYFDVPRLRVGTAGDYLSAGVGYAYKAHRDTWYSSPQCQINWWMPIFGISDQRTMLMFPSLFDVAVPNTSSDFNYQVWIQTGRNQAVSQVKNDERKHPIPIGEVNAPGMRLVFPPSHCLLFSGAHLHQTAPNQSKETRFSIDFRTVSLDDLEAGRGSPNVDCEAGGTTLGDMLRVADFEPMPKCYIK